MGITEGVVKKGGLNEPPTDYRPAPPTALKPASDNPWRETVRDIFDTLHFDQDNIFTGSRLAKRIVALIEHRHRDFFCDGKTMAEWEEEEKRGKP